MGTSVYAHGVSFLRCFLVAGVEKGSPHSIKTWPHVPRPRTSRLRARTGDFAHSSLAVDEPPGVPVRVHSPLCTEPSQALHSPRYSPLGCHHCSGKRNRRAGLGSPSWQVGAVVSKTPVHSHSPGSLRAPGSPSLPLAWAGWPGTVAASAAPGKV